MATSSRRSFGLNASLVALITATVSTAPATAQTADPQSTQTTCPDGSVPAQGLPCPAVTGPAAPATQAEQPLPQSGAISDEEVVVTGSRIARRGTDSSSPIGVIDSAQLETRGFSTVAQALNELPSFGVPGASPVGFNQSSFGAGQSFVDFLGLGSQRTLTLVNGRRFVSSNTSSIFGPTGSGGSQVDLNNIPTKLIDRVETVAAIGAPIYGSDAIAGTINIILKRNYEGLDLDAQYGFSKRGDAPDYRFRFLAGKNFADGRANVTLSGEYNNAKGLLFTDRAVSSSDDRFDLTRASTGARFVPYRDFRVPSISTNGIPLVGGADFGLDLPLSPQQIVYLFGDPSVSGNSFGVQNAAGQTLRFNSTGGLEPIDFGSTIGPDDNFSVFTSGGNGVSLRELENLLTDTERYSVNLLTSYEITDNLRFFGEGWYSVSKGTNLINQPAYNNALFGAAGSRDGSLIIPLSNPFLSASARAAIQEQIANNPLSDQNFNGTPQDYFYLGRANLDLQPGVSQGKNEIWRFVAGLDGTLHVLPDRDWKFEATLNVGRARTTSRNPSLNERNFLNAVNAVRNASGQIVCAPGYVNSPAPTLSSTCAPLNLFGSQISPEAQAYVTSISTPVNLNKQYDGIVSVSGPLIKLPGGNLSFALGYEHREESSRFDPGIFDRGATTDQYPGVDLDGDGDPIDLFYGRSVPIQPVFGKYHTNEIFGELNADIVSPSNDIRFIRELSFNSAGRYVWNSLAGADLTWTAGGRFSPFGFITFRGAYTRAIRAPSVTEAFNPRSSSFVFATDVCDRNQINLGPDPATRARNCAAAGARPDYSSLSNQRSFQGFVFGNSNLTNEKSDSFTVGAVVSPPFLRGFTATVDYVDITLKDAISQFSTSQVVAACYDSPTFPSNPFCSLLTRNLTAVPGSRDYFQLTSVGTSYFNSAQLRYKGILADVRYQTRTPFLGSESRIALSASYQYLDTLNNQVTAGDTPTQINNTVGYSPHKGTLTATYENRGFLYQTQVQYIGKARIAPQSVANTYSIGSVEDVAFVNMAISYDVGKQFTIRASVDNVFDTKPPYPYPLGGATGDPTFVYFSGILGTFIRVGAAVHF